MKDEITSQTSRPASQSVVTPVELAKETLASSTVLPEMGGKGGETSTRREVIKEQWSGAHSQFAYFVHLYIRDFIKFADQKAAFILAIASAILAFLVRQGAHKSLLVPVGNRSFSDWAAFFACVFVSLTGFLSLLVVLPRLRGKSSGVVYWGAFLQSGGASAYKATVRAMDEPRLMNAVLDHCYELAEIADRKYELLKWATWLGALGAISAACVLLGV